MRNVWKALTATVLVGAGGAALVGVAFLQANPLALTTPTVLEAAGARAVPVHEASSFAPASYLPATAPVAQVPDQRRISAMSVPRLTVKPSEAAEANTVGEPDEPGRLVPCSDWIDLGPTSLALEDGDQRRSVRMLCPEGAPVSDYYHQQG